jgi:D-3-phosphoglycerate dehydrogenase / 2-oxoglutarate reductase
MTVNNKRVFYVKYLAHEIYAEIIKARPDVRLDRLENESPDAVAAPILSAAHAYQIGAARDELAKHFHVDADLLRRAPNLLLVSSNGAGFDPVGVHSGGRARGQSIRRQRQFRRRACAGNVADLVKTHS